MAEHSTIQSTETEPVWSLRLYLLHDITPHGGPTRPVLAFRKIQPRGIEQGSVAMTPEKARDLAAQLLAFADEAEAHDHKRDGTTSEQLPGDLFWSADQYAERVMEDGKHDPIAALNVARCYRTLRRWLRHYPSPQKDER